MQKTILSRETKIFGSVLLLVCSVLVCLKLWAVNTKAVSGQSSHPRSGNGQIDLPRVENKTESLQYVGIEYIDTEGENRLVKLQVKNVSGKAITAYTLFIGRTGKIGSDLSIANEAISPGEIEGIIFPAQSLNDPLGTGELQTVTIALAVFEDHSSEGDFQADSDARDWRLGIKTQLQLINQILSDSRDSTMKNKLNNQLKNPLMGLKSVKSQISSLSIERGAKDSVAFKSGLQYAKAMTEMFVEDLEQWEASGRNTTLTRAELGDSVDVNDGIKKIIAWADNLIARY